MDQEQVIGGIRYRVVLWKNGIREVYGRNYRRETAQEIARRHRDSGHWDEVSVEID